MARSDLKVQVVGKSLIADRIAAFEFEAIDQGQLPAWTPGAHIDVWTPSGDLRQYSLCGPLDSSTWRIAALRLEDGRGGSRSLHDQVEVGDCLEVSTPRNNFELRDAPAYLFVAGGIGITPLLPMIETATRDGIPWRLIYGARNAEAMAFRDDLASDARVRLVPQDVEGVVDLGAALGEEILGRRVYCCGPEPMLIAMESAFAGRASEQLHVERFQAELPSGDGDEAFEVELASSGQRITVAAGVSIIDALDGAGIQVESSCREGTCGTCETAVLGGIPEHRDVVLTGDEKAANDCMMICVGRCVEGPLILDL